MKIEGQTIILETGDKFTGEGYTFEVREKQVEPTPTPEPDPPTETPQEPQQDTPEGGGAETP